MKFTKKGYTLVEILVTSAVFMLMILGFVRLITFQGQMLARSRTQQVLQHQASYTLRHIRKYVAGAATVNLEAGEAGTDGRRPVSKIELIGRDGTQKAEYELIGSVLWYQGEPIADKVDGFFTRSQETGDLRKFDLEIVTGDTVRGSEMTSRLVAPTIATRVEPAFTPSKVVKNQTLFEHFQKYSPARKEEAFYSSIQDAIDDADPGDEIRVMGDAGKYFNGVFYEHLTIEKSITLLGAYDEDFETRDLINTPTVINGQRADGVILIRNRMDGNYQVDVTIDGFTITEGATGDFLASGGIVFRDAASSGYTSNLIISNNVITENEGYGGGIHGSLSGEDTLQIFNNTITNNESAQGGGIYVYIQTGASGIIENNVITHNSAVGNIHDGYASWGGGIYAHVRTDDTSLGIRDNIISNNNAAVGGGVWVNVTERASVNMTGNVISENVVTKDNGEGCGVWLEITGGATLTLTDGNIIEKNRAAEGITGVKGGGVLARAIHGAVINISGNEIKEQVSGIYNGGGIHAQSYRASEILVQDNVITNNAVNHYGGGIYAEAREDCHVWGPGKWSVVTLANNDIVANRASGGGGGVYVKGEEQSEITISSDGVGVQKIIGNTTDGHGGGIHIASTPPSSGLKVTVRDSLIRSNTAGDVDNTNTGGGGIYVSARGVGVEVDILRNDIFGNAGGTGGGIGIVCRDGAVTNVWGNDVSPYVNEQDVVFPNIAFRTTAGISVTTYDANTNVNVGSISDHDDDAWKENRVIGNHTQIIGSGGVRATAYDRSFITVARNQINENSVMKEGETGDSSGGGVGASAYNGSTVEVLNNVIIGNRAYGSSGSGGGVQAFATNYASYSGPDAATVLVRGNDIFGNKANQSGGGVHMSAAADRASVIVDNNRINGNDSGQSGGGIRAYADVLGASLVISNNRVEAWAFEDGGQGQGNSGGESGGGVYFQIREGGSANLDSNIIRSNVVPSYRTGAGIYGMVFHSSPYTLIGNTVNSNTPAANQVDVRIFE